MVTLRTFQAVGGAESKTSREHQKGNAQGKVKGPIRLEFHKQREGPKR